MVKVKNYGQVLINGNGLFSKTIQMPTSFIDGNTYNKLNVNLPFSGNALSMTIVAVKLEIGDHQTLAHMDNAGNWVLNELPDFSEELLKCQRFLYVMNFRQLSAVALGYAYSAGIARFFIPFPVTMRDRPAFSYEGTFYIDGINNEVPRISRASYTTPHLAMLATTVVETAYTQYRPLLLVSENAGNKFIFSAEL